MLNKQLNKTTSNQVKNLDSQTLFSRQHPGVDLLFHPEKLSKENWQSIHRDLTTIFSSIQDDLLSKPIQASVKQENVAKFLSEITAIEAQVEHVAQGVKKLGLDLVFDRACHLLDLFQRSQRQISDNDATLTEAHAQLLASVSEEHNDCLIEFEKSMDCFLATPFIGKGRFGYDDMYKHCLTQNYRLNKKKDTIYTVYKCQIQKIISVYKKVDEQTVSCGGKSVVLVVFKNDIGKSITYFKHLDVQSNVYHIKSSQDGQFDFLFSPGGKRVPAASILKGRLYLSDNDDDVSEVANFLEEKNGFYYAKGEKTPFFMSVIEVVSSRQLKHVDKSLGVEKQDPMYGKRKRFKIKKIGYPYSYDTFGKEAVKLSVKSEGVCLITIGFHSFPVVDLSVTDGQDTRPLLEIIAHSKHEKKYYYVHLPNDLDKHGVFFLKSPNNKDYLVSEQHLYETTDHYFTLALNNEVTEENQGAAKRSSAKQEAKPSPNQGAAIQQSEKPQSRLSAKEASEKMRSAKKRYQLRADWECSGHTQSNQEFCRALFDKLMIESA